MAGLATPAPVGEVPRDVALIRDFVNTTDRETATDELDSAAGLTEFLQRSGLLARRTRSMPDELTLAHRLRSGMRRALALNHDGERAPIKELDAALGQLPVRLRWDRDRSRLLPDATGVRGALAALAIAMQSAVDEGTWPRLKICAADECAWAYYDASKNRSRNWCEYGCGNRLKVRAYRARQRVGGRA